MFGVLCTVIQVEKGALCAVHLIFFRMCQIRESTTKSRVRVRAKARARARRDACVNVNSYVYAYAYVYAYVYAYEYTTEAAFNQIKCKTLLHCSRNSNWCQLNINIRCIHNNQFQLDSLTSVSMIFSMYSTVRN